MKNQTTDRSYRYSWQYIIATWFYSGLIPAAPGTFGTIAAFPLYYLLIMISGSLAEIRIWLGTSIVLLTIFGYIAIRRYHEETGLIDHKSIVIDEVIGILLTIAISYQWILPIAIKFAPTDSPHKALLEMFIVATIVFRFFDIRKPFFIRTIEKSMPNAAGVILDDVLAAIYSSGTLYIISSVIK